MTAWQRCLYQKWVGRLSALEPGVAQGLVLRAIVAWLAVACGHGDDERHTEKGTRLGWG